MKKEIGISKIGGLRIARTAFPDTIPNRKSIVSQDRDHFLEIFQQDSQELTLIVDFDGNVKYAGNSIQQLLGFNSFQIVGNSVQKILPVEQWISFRAALRASEEDPTEAIFIECQLINTESKRIYFSLAIRDQRGHSSVQGYVVHAHNIDSLKHCKEKLELKDLAINTIKEAVVIVSPQDSSIEFANQSFYDLSGFTKKEIMGRKINLFRPPYSSMLFCEPTSPLIIEKFLKAIKGEKRFESRIYSKRKNGSIFYNRFSLSPVLSSTGILKHYIVTLKEIQKRSKNKLS